MDSGVRMGVNGHDDLYYKEGCARNFTNDGLSAFNDQLGHGTHVLGIIAGTGSANSRYRGMAPSVGLLGGGIRAAKIFKKDDSAPDGATGNINWTMAAMDWMTLAQDECGFPRPWVVNYSGGGDGDFLTGTDDESRRLDLHVFTHRQLYVDHDASPSGASPSGQYERVVELARDIAGQTRTSAAPGPMRAEAQWVSSGGPPHAHLDGFEPCTDPDGIGPPSLDP